MSSAPDGLLTSAHGWTATRQASGTAPSPRARRPYRPGGQRPGELEQVADRLGTLGGGADPQREVVGAEDPRVSVVGLAGRVPTAGRLEVDAADRAPADRQ